MNASMYQYRHMHTHTHARSHERTHVRSHTQKLTQSQIGAGASVLTTRINHGFQEFDRNDPDSSRSFPAFHPSSQGPESEDDLGRHVDIGGFLDQEPTNIEMSALRCPDEGCPMVLRAVAGCARLSHRGKTRWGQAAVNGVVCLTSACAAVANI